MVDRGPRARLEVGPREGSTQVRILPSPPLWASGPGATPSPRRGGRVRPPGPPASSSTGDLPRPSRFWNPARSGAGRTASWTVPTASARPPTERTPPPPRSPACTRTVNEPARSTAGGRPSPTKPTRKRRSPWSGRRGARKHAGSTAVRAERRAAGQDTRDRAAARGDGVNSRTPVIRCRQPVTGPPSGRWGASRGHGPFTRKAARARPSVAYGGPNRSAAV